TTTGDSHGRSPFRSLADPHTPAPTGKSIRRRRRRSGGAVPWTHGRGPRGPGELGGDRLDPEGRHGAPGRLRRRGLAPPPLRLRGAEPADGMAARGRPRAPRLAGTRGGPGPVLRRRAGPPARPLLRVAP